MLRKLASIPACHALTEESISTSPIPQFFMKPFTNQRLIMFLAFITRQYSSTLTSNMCITAVARNYTSTRATEVGTYFNVPRHTICHLPQPKLKRRRHEKRRSVIFNETVTIHFADVSNEYKSVEKTTWYHSQEIKQMKKMAYSKGVTDSPSCRSDHIYKLLNEIGVENYITPAERLRSCRRRVEACRAALKEQLRQLSFDGELDSKRLAESYKELSKEASLESMRLALADEIVARAVMAGL